MLEFYIKLYHITIVTDLANDIDEIKPPPPPHNKILNEFSVHDTNRLPTKWWETI